MHHAFSSALLAIKADKSLPAEHDLYSALIGEWDFEWVDGQGTANERRVPGEWLFSWILEGRAVQDIFICPSREARKTLNPPDAEYGTTIRVFNPEKQAWDAMYLQSKGLVHLEGRRGENGEIVHNCTSCQGYQMHWVFSEITPETFRWRNSVSQDEGKTWQLVGELFARRRTSS